MVVVRTCSLSLDLKSHFIWISFVKIDVPVDGNCLMIANQWEDRGVA